MFDIQNHHHISQLAILWVTRMERTLSMQAKHQCWWKVILQLHAYDWWPGSHKTQQRFACWFLNGTSAQKGYLWRHINKWGGLFTDKEYVDRCDRFSYWAANNTHGVQYCTASLYFSVKHIYKANWLLGHPIDFLSAVAQLLIALQLKKTDVYTRCRRF
jgi:hypothetical protein